MENVQPEKRFQAGAISATVWKNTQQKDGKEFDFFSVSLQRSYKDQAGAWKHTTSLRSNDVPKAKLVLDKAWEFLELKPA
ncbi:hypothetical protein COV11_04520 [Candidatus Woesearchaeota archaeon CG10_big_fil_rev_8_21_14_0_10_30_7]|nr:MAG: hypothetical protein COV11_04520 [Candidatus Woesearchaeota archaeon CG10_big_fil_rev_8_21_14_0_10_30_7]